MPETLQKIMTPSPHCVNEDDLLLTLKHIYEQKDFHHHIPVTASGKVIGMVSLLDFMHAIGNATLDNSDLAYQKRVGEIMSRNIISLASDRPVDEALKIFIKNEIHAIPITENEKIVGIVTSTDLLKFYAEKLH